MHFSYLLTTLLATAPIVNSAPAALSAIEKLHLAKSRDLDSNTGNGHPHLVRDLVERGYGRMNFPMFLGILPKGLNFTVDEIKTIIPKGMEAWNADGPKVPFTITADQVEAAAKKGWTGVFLGHFYTQAPGMNSGQGASHQIKFTMAGRTPDGIESQAVKGTLTIATSEWNKLSRPDNVFFNWLIEGSDGNFSAATPTLVPLPNTVIAIVYNAVTKQYQFAVANQGVFTQKLAQMAVDGIIAGHEFIWNEIATMTGLSLAMTVASWVPKLLFK